MRGWPAVLPMLVVAACATAPPPAPVPPATPLRELPLDEITYVPREDVEGWPEERRQRFMPFLDECRAAAASFMETWKGGDIDALYREVSQELRDQLPRAEFATTVEDIRRATGDMEFARLSQQALVIPRDELQLAEPYTEVVYALPAAPPATGSLVFVMGLVRSGGACRVASFSYVGVTGQPGQRRSAHLRRGLSASHG